MNYFYTLVMKQSETEAKQISTAYTYETLKNRSEKKLKTCALTTITDRS
jgi:hypothetical protein